MGVVRRDSPLKDEYGAWSEQGGEPQALRWALPHLRLPGPHLFSGQESFCVYLSFGVYLSLWVLGCHVGAPAAEIPA